MKTIQHNIHLQDREKHRARNIETLTALFTGLACLLYMPLLISVLRAEDAGGVEKHIPYQLSIGIVMLVYSGRLLYALKRARQLDDLKKFRRNLMWLTSTGLCFILIQLYALNEMSGATANLANAVKLLVLAHIFQVMGGIVCWVALLLRTLMSASSADMYIHFLRPANTMFFRASVNYWNFTCTLWTVLYITIIIKYGN